jgi:DNA-binding SARP family transcriptional activator
VTPVVVRLLGAPSVDTGGASVPAPRGRKSWALLSYLVLTDRPPSRQRLATLLFPDADDPLGALRWSLADLRRGLRPYAEVTGDPVRLVLADGVTTDVAMLSSGPFSGSTEPLDGQLLEGLTFEGCPGFEAWLHVERRRLAGLCEALMHEEALLHLGSRRFDAAVATARSLVAMNPLDENYQALLVRCLTASGQREAALDQVDECTRVFLRELGTGPSAAVRAAADGGSGVTRSPVMGRAAAVAQLEAGEAAVNAGAIDAGLECLRRAVAEAGACSDAPLRRTALVALGSALVHGARGRDEEGAAVLHEALAEAGQAGDPSIAARACRELGFIDVQAGRRQRAEEWLAKAEVLAVDDEEELSAVLGIRGMNLSDVGRYGDALASLENSVDRALNSGARRQAAWSASLVGRIHLLRGDTDAAVEALERSMLLVRDEQWMAFAPWPESLRAEVERTEGRADQAADLYSHAFALACQLGDPCWEGVAARGSGLLHADAGDLPAALGWFEDARTRCTRWPDTYQWIHAYVLDAACEVTVAAGEPSAALWVDRLTEVAARGAMTEFVVRSHVHRAHLGQAGAAEAAAHAVADLDNPVVVDLVAGL